MGGFIVAPAAEEDLLQIWRYLYESKATAIADRVEAELYAVFAELSATPGQGHTRGPDFSSSVFFHALLVHDCLPFRESRGDCEGVTRQT